MSDMSETPTPSGVPNERPPMAGYDLSQTASYASADLACDLIMKGGITSGVIYPLAACRLATRYRFKKLGGASAGAIAAAFTAAAELGRSKPKPAGFAGLNTLPDEMGKQLSTLFQPDRSTKPAYRLLTAWIEPDWGTLRKIGTTIALLIRYAAVVFVVAFLAAMAPGVAVAAALQHGPDWPHWWTPRRSWLVWVIGSLIVALIAAAVRISLKTMKAMTANGFGLCNGHDSDGTGNLALTDWMANKLDELAGLGADGPLLFEHLRDPDPATDIDLQVMTTCLTLRRPYRFPFSTNVFLVCEHCMGDYFPPNVVAALMVGTEPNLAAGQSANCPVHGSALRHLPPADKVPVVVAARISLSFPGLISAVPFHYIDFSRAADPKPVVTAWFSDGGIASNFPMHFFDQLLPTRPTFGINLQPVNTDWPNQTVWRPANTGSGVLPRAHAITSMPSFVGAILDTMQNWNDSTQLALPGFRDRVAEVRTTADEGGMNLKMRPETIRALAERGSQAALLFEEFDMQLHQWIRYRVAMEMLDETLERLDSRYRPAADHPGYEAFISEYGPTTTSYTMSAPQRAADQAATRALMNVATQWEAAGHPATAGNTPHPRPSIRLVPPQ